MNDVTRLNGPFITIERNDVRFTVQALFLVDAFAEYAMHLHATVNGNQWVKSLSTVDKRVTEVWIHLLVVNYEY